LGGRFQFLVEEFCQPLGFRVFVGKEFLITAVKILKDPGGEGILSELDEIGCHVVEEEGNLPEHFRFFLL